MKMKRKIYFRADASVSIGYGHFIRTLALADMLRDDFDCTFFTCHPTPYQVDEMEKVCPFLALREETHYDDFLSHLQGDEIVVLDNYFFDTGYQRAIKGKGCRLVCIDDMHDKHYVADVVINHGLTDESLFDVEPYTKLCLGLDWALLRKEFYQPLLRKRREEGHWLVSFGGSDFYNLTFKYVDFLQQFPSVRQITVIVGDSYKYKEMLDSMDKVTLTERLSAQEIQDLFSVVSVAILPSSTIAIEALACGCPVVSGYYIDNQRGIYGTLLSRNLIVGIGDMLSIDRVLISEKKMEDIKSLRSCVFDSRIKEKFIYLFNVLSYENTDIGR